MNAPNDIRAEQCVLAALLHRPATANRVKLSLKTPEYFHDRRHQALYAALINQADRAEVADWVTTRAEVERLGWLGAFNGSRDACEDYVRMIAEDVPEARDGDFNIVGWMNRVQDKWVRREGQKAAYQFIDFLGDPTQSPADTIRQYQSTVSTLSRIADGRELQSFGDIASDILTDALDRKAEAEALAGSGVLGLPSGIPGLTELSGGWKPGMLIMLGGWEKTGKTSLTMQSADAIAGVALQRHPGGELGGSYIGSLEMTAQELVEKVLLSHAEIDSMKVHAGTFDDDEAVRLEKTITKIRDRRIYIDDLKGSPWSEIRGSIIAAHEQFGIDVAFIDYAQIIKKEPGSRLDKKDHLAEVVEDAKALAKKLGVVIVMLSQLKRFIKRKDGKYPRPSNSDLAESAALERAADMIVLIWSKGPEQLTEYERHLRQSGAVDAHDRYVTELLVTSRASKGGTVVTVFNATLGRFEAPKKVSDQFLHEKPAAQPDKPNASLEQFPDPEGEA